MLRILKFDNVDPDFNLIWNRLKLKPNTFIWEIMHLINSNIFLILNIFPNLIKKF